MIKFLDLGALHRGLARELDVAIGRVIEDSSFVCGEAVSEFCQSFADFLGAKYCVGVGNGTDALEIIIEAMDFPPSSEIIVPANTFVATAEAVVRCGHRPVFCDCNQENFTVDVKDLENRISERTVAIVPVHLYGHPCDMDSVMVAAKSHGLKVIEDCAQAHGARYRGRSVGTFGDAGAFSFYPGKNLGALGDGGAIISNSEELARKCSMLSNHGRVAKYEHEFVGRNSRLDSIQAAVLSVKLLYLEEWNARRCQVASRYEEGLDRGAVVLPSTAGWAKHVWHLYVVQTDNRDELKSFLHEQGIETGIHYPIALTRLQAFKSLGQAEEELNAHQMEKRLLSLPMGPHLTDDMVQSVIDAVNSYSRAAQ